MVFKLMEYKGNVDRSDKLVSVQPNSRAYNLTTQQESLVSL